jgi:hypothetical protein
MPKKQPTNTVGRVIFLPKDLHQKIKAMVEHGEVDGLIVECLEEGVGTRYRRWLKKENAKLGKATP